MSNVLQWKRSAHVVIGKGGTGLLVKDLRIQFEILKTMDESPNTAVIKIFNLHPNNEAKIKNEFDDVLLFVGYGETRQMIFRGNIVRVYRYRMQNDYITEIEGGDGDRDYRQAVMNETVAAGTTPEQLVERAVASFGGLGETIKGYVKLPAKTHLRGKVVSGNTRDVLRNIAKESRANWSIQDGQLTMVQVDQVLPNLAIVIRSDTGMLGAPEINDKGIAVKTLLNPHISINGTIRLDNNGIRAKRQKAQALASAAAKPVPADPVRLDPDGVYKVLQVTHKGDTRGADWVSEVECIGITQPIPSSVSVING